MERGLFGVGQSDLQAESTDMTEDISADVDFTELSNVIPEDTASDITDQSAENKLIDIPEDTVPDVPSHDDAYDLDELPEDTVPDVPSHDDAYDLAELPEDTAGDMKYNESAESEIEISEDDHPDVETSEAGEIDDVSQKSEGLPEDVGNLEREPPKETKTDQDIYKTVDDVLGGASKEEIDLYGSFPVHSGIVDDRPSLKRDDLEPFKETGEKECNLDLMQEGKAPHIDGVPIELHHIGQKMDSPVAELTSEEHRGTGNDAILHDKTKQSEIDRSTFSKEKDHYWRARTQEILQDEIEKGDQA